MAETILLDLPPELQLRILSSLPARQIQQCRRVNKYFQQLIDNEENHGICFGPGIYISLAAIQNDVVIACDFPTDTTYPDGTSRALVDAVANLSQFQRRLGHKTLNKKPCVSAIARHWLHKMPSLHPTLPDQEMQELQYQIIVEQLKLLAIILEWSIYSSAECVLGRMTEDEYYSGLQILAPKMASSGNLAGWSSEDEIETVMKKFRDSGYEHVVQSILRVGRPGEGPAFAFLESPSDHEYEAWEEYGRKNAAVTARLARILGVPALERTAPVTYYVRSQRALDDLKLVLHGNMELEKPQKAAILDEMFIA